MQKKLFFKGQNGTTAAPSAQSAMEVEKQSDNSHLLPWVEK